MGVGSRDILLPMVGGLPPPSWGGGGGGEGTAYSAYFRGYFLAFRYPLPAGGEPGPPGFVWEGGPASGFARGILREYVPMGWTWRNHAPGLRRRGRLSSAPGARRPSHQGKFWSYQAVAIWPRPVQQPHPPVWVPVTVSKETLEWAARENVPITPGANGQVGGGTAV